MLLCHGSKRVINGNSESRLVDSLFWRQKPFRVDWLIFVLIDVSCTMVRDEKPRTVYWLDDKLYLNITNKCSNRCIFCFRNFKRGVSDFTLKLPEEPSFEQVALELDEAMKRKRWREVVFCGFGEPTERLDLLLAACSVHQVALRRLCSRLG